MHKKSADVNKIPLFGQIYRLCRHKRSSTSTHPDTAWTIWSWWRRWKVFLWLLTCCKGIQWDDYTFIHKMSIFHQMPTWDKFYNLRWWYVSIFYNLRWPGLLSPALSVCDFIIAEIWSATGFQSLAFQSICFLSFEKMVRVLLFLSARSNFHLSHQFYQFFFCWMEKFSSSVKLESGRLWAIFAAVISCIRAKSCTKFAFKLNITFSKHTLSS